MLAQSTIKVDKDRQTDKQTDKQTKIKLKKDGATPADTAFSRTHLKGEFRAKGDSKHSQVN